MNNLRWLLSLIFCCAFVGCATAPLPVVTPAPAAHAAAPSAVDPRSVKEAADYRQALEEAYAAIVARESKPVDAPHVDVEAAVSMDIPEHRTIRGAINLFSTDLKPSVQTYLLNGARYKRLIEKALTEQGLPKGLAYLPVIESGYSPTLTSRAGAHGIWQFMPDTAREYGLRVDWWVDERADPERSTRAAAAYLKDLYHQFNDWPLTLAAYNAGPGRIRRALDNNGATSFWQLCDAGAIPKETRGYVPTFYATLVIASDPATYGFRLNDPVDWDDKRVDVDGPVSLRYLAELAGVDESRMRELNPALRRGIVPPGRASVRVPAKAAEQIATRATSLRNDDANVAVCAFTLRDGDSLHRIARAIGSDLDTILAMNNLGSASRVGEGDSIYLPVRARELGALLSHSASDRLYYAVAKGDTLYSIAKRYDLTVDELLDLNQLDRDHKLHPGEKLRVGAKQALTAGGM